VNFCNSNCAAATNEICKTGHTFDEICINQCSVMADDIKKTTKGP